MNKCMNNTFGSLTQPFIENTMIENSTSVLELLMSHDTRAKNQKKDFRVLSCVIYTIIYNDVYIEHLDFQYKK